MPVLSLIRRYFFYTIAILFILTFHIEAQIREKLTSPEWKEFKIDIAEFDAIMHEIQRLQKEYPEIATNPTKLQELLGDKLMRFSELYQSIPRKLPAELKNIDNCSGFGIDELRVLKYATNIAQNFALALDVNLALVDVVQDADSIRNLSAEAVQFAVFADRLELAESMLRDGVLDSAEQLQRVMLFNSMSGTYAEKKEIDRSREYALLAMKASGEALRTVRAEGNNDQYQQIEAYLAQQTGGTAADLLHEFKKSADVNILEQFKKALQSALADESAWPSFERSINEQLSNIEKDQEALNQPAEEWQEHLWIGGTTLSLAALKGKVILVDFFATWCRPCIMAFPYLKQWQEKYEDKGLVVVGLTNYQGRYDGTTLKPEEEFASLRDDFIPKHKITWPVGIEKNGRQTMLDYGVQGIPHIVLIDREGKIQYVKVGASDYDKTEKKIQELLSQ